tara:strand:+ start:3496 stop:5286 length:1791 start_codon:yes stop_codon:yes gene_type:complete
MSNGFRAPGIVGGGRIVQGPRVDFSGVSQAANNFHDRLMQNKEMDLKNKALGLEALQWFDKNYGLEVDENGMPSEKTQELLNNFLTDYGFSQNNRQKIVNAVVNAPVTTTNNQQQFNASGQPQPSVQNQTPQNWHPPMAPPGMQSGGMYNQPVAQNQPMFAPGMPNNPAPEMSDFEKADQSFMDIISDYASDAKNYALGVPGYQYGGMPMQSPMGFQAPSAPSFAPAKGRAVNFDWEKKKKKKKQTETEQPTAPSEDTSQATNVETYEPKSTEIEQNVYPGQKGDKIGPYANNPEIEQIPYVKKPEIEQNVYPGQQGDKIGPYANDPYLGTNQELEESEELGVLAQNILGLEEGRYIPGNETGDNNLIKVEDREYVLNRNAVEGLGKGYLDYINFERFPRFKNKKESKPNEFKQGGLFDFLKKKEPVSYDMNFTMNPERQMVRDAQRTNQWLSGEIGKRMKYDEDRNELTREYEHEYGQQWLPWMAQALPDFLEKPLFNWMVEETPEMNWKAGDTYEDWVDFKAKQTALNKLGTFKGGDLPENLALTPYHMQTWRSLYDMPEADLKHQWSNESLKNKYNQDIFDSGSWINSWEPRR